MKTRDTKHNAEFIYNMILTITEEDIYEVEDIIEEIARIHCRICDYPSWNVYIKPKPATEDDE